MSHIDKLGLAEHRYLLDVAQTLAAENDVSRLCEIILEESRRMTRADGGTLYLIRGHGKSAVLDFAIVINQTLGLALGGKSGEEIPYESIPLYMDGLPNHHNVASHAGLTGNPVNIADVYQAEEYDFSGTRAFDERFAYRTRSVLCIPLKNQQGEPVAVLQLLNARGEAGAPAVFTADDEPVVMALASFAAIALQKQKDIDEQKKLLETLAGEPNTALLLERIVSEAKAITHADGGTLYLFRDEDGPPRLEFALLHNSSLELTLGGDGKPIDLPPIALHCADGSENHHHVAAHAALTGELVNIADAYADDRFDFSGTREFDKKNGYRSTSFLAVPLLDHANELIGVLQLVNARSQTSLEVIPFAESLEPLIVALAKYAAIALNNTLLVEEHKNLLDAFVKVIATAIDAKSPHTSRHCQKVPVIAELLTQAACDDTKTFADFQFDEDEWYELRVAAWLHDCGKLATPDHVLDKSTKLHTLYDRIEAIKTRCASLRQQLEAEYWQARCWLDTTAAEPVATLEAKHRQAVQALADDLAFLVEVNQGGEFLQQEAKQRIRQIAQRQWRDENGELQPLLSDDEVYNLSIERGTLNAEERQIINDHIVVTIDMLESLPFPRKLRRVPEYAGNHHERMDGTGFPRGLTREQMSIPARIMAIADIFEALTSQDRPYKQPMKLSQALSIMKNMRDNNHIDPDLYDLFLRHRVWETYARQELSPEQLDINDASAYF